jgi:DNA-binding FadR family transcriptional regulator
VSHAPKTAQLVAWTLRRMVIDGQLQDGEYLPHEGELMEHFQISRPTLREAVRVLESDRLIEVRRKSRTGARVSFPGAEIVASPAALLLEVSGASLGDVMIARAPSSLPQRVCSPRPAVPQPTTNWRVSSRAYRRRVRRDN